MACVEVRVPTAQCQTVWLANCGADDDLNWESEVPGHTANHHRLLCVFLAEIRSIGTDYMEELGDHCRHSVKVARPGRALELAAELTDRDSGLAARRIHLVHIGGEDHIHALRLE